MVTNLASLLARKPLPGVGEHEFVALFDRVAKGAYLARHQAGTSVEGARPASGASLSSRQRCGS